MNSERDATRIVRSWLESGSTAIPDRVVDAVLAELPSRPQRRSTWSSWRSQPMKFILPIAVGAAALALVAAVFGSQFLASDSTVGGPTSSPTSSPLASPAVVGGSFTFAGDISVDMSALSDGLSLSGTTNGSYGGQDFTIEHQCLRQFDADTWMLAGTLTKSAVAGNPVGSWAAVIVRDGAPQQAGIYTESAGTADDCAEFVREVPDLAVEGPEAIAPMDEGHVTLPPASSVSPAASDVPQP